jgi:hypothetical protein
MGARGAEDKAAHPPLSEDVLTHKIIFTECFIYLLKIR